MSAWIRGMARNRDIEKIGEIVHQREVLAHSDQAEG